MPPDLIYLVEPTVPALVRGIDCAIDDYVSGKQMCPVEAHKRIASFYNWFNVTKRTEIVYGLVDKEDHKNLGEQLASYIPSGVLPYLLVVSLCYIILQALEYLVPRKVGKDV